MFKEQKCSERQEIKANRSEVVLFKGNGGEKSGILLVLCHAILDESSQSCLLESMGIGYCILDVVTCV